MSGESDAWEHAIAASINNSVPGLKAERPKVSVKFPDVRVDYKNFQGDRAIWVEVKMNHTDNLMNPRFTFIDGKWGTTEAYASPAVDVLCEYWNDNAAAQAWLEDLRKFLTANKWKGDVRNMSLYSTKTERAIDKNSVSFELMKKYLASIVQKGRTKNICKEDNVDVGKLVSTHYLKGKGAIAYYVSSKDDFYQFKLPGSKSNPLMIPDVPVFKGHNTIVLRVGDRSGNFEIQAEVKLKALPHSDYSVAPKTKKVNPFTMIRVK